MIQIFIVYSTIVDSTGKLTISTPQPFDSNHYKNDVDKAQRKADAAASTIWAEMCESETGRKLQVVDLKTADGASLTGYPKTLGTLAEPEPEPEPAE